jgi:hypothetical protein
MCIPLGVFLGESFDLNYVNQLKFLCIFVIIVLGAKRYKRQLVYTV